MKFSPYSFSKISSFQQCPTKFKYDYIEKLGVFQKSKALEKGSFVHEWLENVGNGILKKPKYNFKLSSEEDIKEYENIFKKFISSDIGKFYLNKPLLGVEIPFGVKLENNKFAHSKYGDKENLFRGKIDHSFIYNNELYLVDWKTGKLNPWQNFLQLEMYAVWGFLVMPEIETIKASFVYIEHLEKKEITYKKENFNKILKNVISEIHNIETEKSFPKKETALCDFCSYRKEGICEESTQQDFLQNVNKYNPKKY